jgi:hypothetical protein
MLQVRRVTQLERYSVPACTFRRRRHCEARANFGHLVIKGARTTESFPICPTTMPERRSGIPCAVSTEHVLWIGSVVIVSATAYEFGLLLDRSSCPSGRHVFFDYRILDQDVYRSARSTTRPLPGKTPAGETRFGTQHSQRPSIPFGPAFNGHARRYSRPVEVLTPACF